VTPVSLPDVPAPVSAALIAALAALVTRWLDKRFGWREREATEADNLRKEYRENALAAERELEDQREAYWKLREEHLRERMKLDAEHAAALGELKITAERLKARIDEGGFCARPDCPARRDPLPGSEND
jgi:hypothetical protein